MLLETLDRTNSLCLCLQRPDFVFSVNCSWKSVGYVIPGDIACARVRKISWAPPGPVSAEGQNESRRISSVVRAGLLLSGRESHLSTLGRCSSRGRRSYKCLSSLTESAAAHCQIDQSMDVLTSMARAECTAYYIKPSHVIRGAVITT